MSENLLSISIIPFTVSNVRIYSLIVFLSFKASSSPFSNSFFASISSVSSTAFCLRINASLIHLRKSSSISSTRYVLLSVLPSDALYFANHFLYNVSPQSDLKVFSIIALRVIGSISEIAISQ